MKSSIFSKSFEEIFTTPRLLYELSRLVPRPRDYAQVQQEIRAGDFFDPAPKQSFSLPKSNGEFRQITLSSTKTKVIQKVLATELGHAMHFSDRSYAFRKGKSPYKAVMRVRDALRRYSHIAKADIHAFFDSIDHEILIQKLTRII